MFFINSLRLLIGLTLILELHPRSMAQTTNEEENFLKKMCVLGFNSEMATANKTPPNGMATFTCNCFLDKISLKYSVESAKENCKNKASQKFNL